MEDYRTIDLYKPIRRVSSLKLSDLQNASPVLNMNFVQ